MTQLKTAAGAMLIAIAALSLPTPAAAQIVDQSIEVGSQTVRYLSSGTEGPAIILLHGWPQTADEFREIMPELAKYYSIYAPDLSGIGGSTAPSQRWDKAALASDVKAFADQLGLEDPLVVGHDIGGMVAYAYARQYPEDLAGVAILDVPVPGLAPADDIAISPYAWHYDFHKQVGLAETLVDGQQADYFSYFIGKNSANPAAVSPEEIAVYAKAYGSRDALRAGFELYRAFDEDAVFFNSRVEAFAVPTLVVGAEFSTAAVLPVMAQSFADRGVANLETLVIKDSGHWLSEEQPAATAQAIRNFADKVFDN